MKKSIVFASALVIGSFTLARAANAPSSTPGTGKIAVHKPAANPHPLVHQVNMRVRNQWMLMQKGLKAGKITKDEALTIRAGLKDVREQELGFFKQNRNHDLTSDQQGQLNALLDKNSATLGETPGASK